MAQGKRFKAAIGSVDREKTYSLDEAVKSALTGQGECRRAPDAATGARDDGDAAREGPRLRHQRPSSVTTTGSSDRSSLTRFIERNE